MGCLAGEGDLGRHLSPSLTLRLWPVFFKISKDIKGSFHETSAISLGFYFRDPLILIGE